MSTDAATIALTLTSPAKPTTPQPRETVRQFASLTMFTIIGVLLVGALALVMIARLRRSLGAGPTRSKQQPTRSDAWSESAKRVPVRSPADDDTVDIDPDDLSPDDVDGDGPGGKRGPRR